MRRRLSLLLALAVVAVLGGLAAQPGHASTVVTVTPGQEEADPGAAVRVGVHTGELACDGAMIHLSASYLDARLIERSTKLGSVPATGDETTTSIRVPDDASWLAPFVVVARLAAPATPGCDGIEGRGSLTVTYREYTGVVFPRSGTAGSTFLFAGYGCVGAYAGVALVDLASGAHHDLVGPGPPRRVVFAWLTVPVVAPGEYFVAAACGQSLIAAAFRVRGEAPTDG